MDILEFYNYVAKLKRLKRTAWVREGIDNSESVAAHSFSTAVLAMILASRFNVDRERLIKMALIHDIGESIIGDIVTTRGGKIDKQKLKNKESREDKAIIKILSSIENGQEYLSLWREMRQRQTIEAKLLWDIDKLDAVLQTVVYEESNKIDLKEIFVYAETYIQHPNIKKMLSEIKSRRKKIILLKQRF